MASTDGSTSSGTDGSEAVDPGRRRGKTAAEQRQERVTVSNDPEELAAEIERTREELAETFDAIADKVSPKRVAGRTKKKAGDAVKAGAEQAAANVKAGAAQLKDAALEKKETLQDTRTALQDKVGAGSSSTQSLPTPVAGSGVAAAVDGAPVAVPPSDLRPVSTPSYGVSSSTKLGPPAAAGAAAAVRLVLLLLRRRRRRNASRWR